MITNESSRAGVLLVIPNFEIGGTEKRMRLLAFGLQSDERYAPVVCSLSGDGPMGEIMREQGIPVEILHKRGKVDPILVPQLMSIINTYDVKIVHGFMFAGNCWGRLAGRLAGVPVAFATEGSLPVWKSVIHRAIDHRLGGAGQGVVCNAEAVRQMAVTQGALRPATVHVVPNGVDIDRFQPVDNGSKAEVRERLGLPNSTVLVGTVCRFDPNKDILGLIESFGLVARPDIDLVIVGGAKGDKEQRYLKTVKSAVESSDMRPRIYMVGQQSDIPMFLGAMDLYVQSSTREGLSNALMEAMACGLPVVATDVGGTGELVSHGSTGFIVPPNDPIALARAMNELASDTESRSQMGEAGRKLVVDHYSSAAFLRRMTALYDTGLANAAAKC